MIVQAERIYNKFHFYTNTLHTLFKAATIHSWLSDTITKFFLEKYEKAIFYAGRVAFFTSYLVSIKKIKKKKR